MKREQLYLSTIAPDAARLAGEYGLGLEIAEFCTAYFMDQQFPETDEAVRSKLKRTARATLHGPFNELFPAAIDPKARALAAERYRQAMELAKNYGAEKVILHSGYAPSFYYDCWFEEQSAGFWRELLDCVPRGMTVCLENVLETQPEPLLHVVEAVDDSRLRICLDVGHANAYSKRPVTEWLTLFAPYTAHFHIHNNDQSCDSHGHLFQGSMDMAALLRQADRLCPEASFALEIPEPEADIRWLLEREIID